MHAGLQVALKFLSNQKQKQIWKLTLHLKLIKKNYCYMGKHTQLIFKAHNSNK